MHWGVAAAFFTALALVGAVPAHASSNARYGIQDDAWLLYGPGTLSERVTTLQGLGVGVVRVTLYGSPRWANGGASAATLPSTGFGDFAYASAVRFPWVRMWTIWNEPNNRTFAVPVSPSLYVSRVLNPAYVSLHAASAANQV